jgi:hypothetical protein
MAMPSTLSQIWIGFIVIVDLEFVNSEEVTVHVIYLGALFLPRFLDVESTGAEVYRHEMIK